MLSHTYTCLFHPSLFTHTHSTPSHQVVVGVVQHYVDKVATHIPEYVGELETVSSNS